VQGKARAPFCKAAANLGVRARDGTSPRFAGGDLGRALREEEDRPGERDRAGSERVELACGAGLQRGGETRRCERAGLRRQVGPAWQWGRAGRALRAGEAELRRGRGETGRAQREKAAGRAGPV
jgi:hypothetical protein